MLPNPSEYLRQFIAIALVSSVAIVAALTYQIKYVPDQIIDVAEKYQYSSGDGYLKSADFVYNPERYTVAALIFSVVVYGFRLATIWQLRYLRQPNALTAHHGLLAIFPLALVVFSTIDAFVITSAIGRIFMNTPNLPERRSPQ